jgi:hypothetical protein
VNTQNTLLRLSKLPRRRRAVSKKKEYGFGSDEHCVRHTDLPLPPQTRQRQCGGVTRCARQKCRCLHRNTAACRLALARAAPPCVRRLGGLCGSIERARQAWLAVLDCVCGRGPQSKAPPRTEPESERGALSVCAPVVSQAHTMPQGDRGRARWTAETHDARLARFWSTLTSACVARVSPNHREEW